MTTRSDEPDDAFWQRPAGPPNTPSGTSDPSPGPPGVPTSPAPPPRPTPAASPYPGPPPSLAPPPGWRPPVHVQPAPPRPLPAQDMSGLDADEGSARTLTYGVGMIAGAVLLVVICLLCTRFLF